MTVFCVFPLQVPDNTIISPLTASVNATSATVCVTVGCLRWTAEFLTLLEQTSCPGVMLNRQEESCMHDHIFSQVKAC